jgi:hypothetical protein
MLPATERRALAHILLKPKRSQSFREEQVVAIGSKLGDHVNIVGTTHFGRSRIGDEQPGRTPQTNTISRRSGLSLAAASCNRSRFGYSVRRCLQSLAQFA